MSLGWMVTLSVLLPLQCVALAQPWLICNLEEATTSNLSSFLSAGGLEARYTYLLSSCFDFFGTILVMIQLCHCHSLLPLIFTSTYASYLNSVSSTGPSVSISAYADSLLASQALYLELDILAFVQIGIVLAAW